MTVAILVAVVLVAAACGGTERASPAGTGDRPRAAVAVRAPLHAPWSSLPPGWSRLAWLPFWRNSAVALWTGSEVVFWGGDAPSDVVHHADGGAFDPKTRKWRPIPEAPIGGRSQAGAVWSGSELLVWGGTAGGPLAGGAAYDPVSRSWRHLPAAPLDARIPAAVAWTGREMIVWGDKARNVGDVSGAAYDPQADRWRELPPAPVALNQATGVWTGRELIVIGSLLDGNNRSRTQDVRGAAYDPATDSWRQVTPYALSPQASSATWTGREVLVWDYELNAAAYNPSEGTWRKLPSVPLEFSECYPESARVGRFVVAWFCGTGAVFDLKQGEWRRIPSRRGAWMGPIPAGSVALFLGSGGLLAYDP